MKEQAIQPTVETNPLCTPTTSTAWRGDPDGTQTRPRRETSADSIRQAVDGQGGSRAVQFVQVSTVAVSVMPVRVQVLPESPLIVCCVAVTCVSSAVTNLLKLHTRTLTQIWL